MATIFLNRMKTITCGGVSVLETTIKTQHDNAGFIVVFTIIMALFALTFLVIAPIFILKSRDRTSSNLAAYVYSFITFLGAVFGYVACIWWFLVPDGTWICQLRVWFTAVGLTLLLVGLFCRLVGIHYIYIKVYQKKSLKTTFLSPLVVAIAALFLFCIQLILLIIWAAVDLWRSQLTQTDTLNLISEYECSSDNIAVWLSLEAVYFAILLMYGVFVLYHTWDIKSSVSEAKWVLIGEYNSIIALAILIPLVVVLNIDDDALFFLATIPLTFVIVSITAALFLPKFLSMIYKSAKTSLDKTRSGASVRNQTSKSHSSSN